MANGSPRRLLIHLHTRPIPDLATICGKDCAAWKARIGRRRCGTSTAKSTPSPKETDGFSIRPQSRTDFQSVPKETDGLKIRPTLQANAWLPYVWRTQVHVQLGRFEQAAADFDKAIQLGPPEQVLVHFRSYATETPDKAAGQAAFWYLDHLMAARPGDAVLYLDRGRANLRRNQWQEAARDFDAAAQRELNDPRIWWEKGIATVLKEADALLVSKKH